MIQMPRHIEDVAARARIYMRQGRPLGLQVVWHSSLLFPCHLLLSLIPYPIIPYPLIPYPFIPYTFIFCPLLLISPFPLRFNVDLRSGGRKVQSTGSNRLKTSWKSTLNHCQCWCWPGRGADTDAEFWNCQIADAIADADADDWNAEDEELLMQRKGATGV